MSDLPIVEIFFIITGTAVVFVAVVLIILALYIISFVRTIKSIATTANRAAEIISEDASIFREQIKAQGFKIGTLASFAKALMKLKNIKNSKK